MAKGCKLKYTSGGIGGDGEVDVFCAKVQFELQFINKYDTVESYADDYIFKMVGNVRQPELTNNYSTYDKFDCYALVYPHREKKPYIDFPVVISAYKRIKDDKWRYITTTTAKNMEEYGNFEDKVIHNAYGDKLLQLPVLLSAYALSTHQQACI